MKLSEAIEKDWPLVVIHPLGGTRYAPEVFILEKSIVFLDFGWDQSSTHAIHEIRGRLTGKSPWKIGSAIIRIIDEDDSVIDEFMEWKYYRTTEDGKKATREAARRYMNQTYGIIE